MVAKMHRLHLPKIGEGVLHIPGGVPFETDDTEVYPVGSYLRLGNKGFVYAESLGITNTGFGVKQDIDQSIGWSNIGADAEVGVTQVVVTVASDAGVLGNGRVTKDYFKGGEIMIGDTGTRLNVISRGVIGNDALTTAGGDMIVYLDAPIPVALVEDTSVCEMMASPYRGVKTQTNAHQPVMGMATCIAASGKFLWLQVEGICGGCISQTDFGWISDMQCVFRADGSMGKHDPTDGSEKYQQHAGFIVAPNPSNVQGLPFIMLQIAH